MLWYKNYSTCNCIGIIRVVFVVVYVLYYWLFRVKGYITILIRRNNQQIIEQLNVHDHPLQCTCKDRYVEARPCLLLTQCQRQYA